MSCCPRIICETWQTEGRSREMHTPCMLPKGHEGPHVWGYPVEILR